MIQYTLKCADGHSFDSWFQSASAFDKLHAAGLVNCSVCGTFNVEKALMTPRVSHNETRRGAVDNSEKSEKSPLSSAPKHPAEQALAELKRHVEQNTDYVGKDFAQEARAMHEGQAPERPIWGEAKPQEAKALVDDGIAVTPLPFLPTRKTN